MGRILDLFINKYNYTDFHELNLDWIISDLRTLAETLENFINLNTIKYANPIQWNITTQYESNTVVIDGNTGTAYLSVKPVPAGVALTNTDYWTPIFTLNLLSTNQNITLRDDGSNVLATFASDTGDWLLWNNTLYKVTRAIALNESYVVGYNIERYTVELFIKDAIDTINNEIGELTDLNTTDKSNIVSALNEVLTTITNKNIYAYPENYGAVGDGVTDDSAAIQAAVDSRKIVYLRNSYAVDSISITADTVIVGSNESVIKPNVVTGTILCKNVFTATANLTLNNVTFEGQGRNPNTGTERYSIIDAKNCDKLILNGCTFKNIGHDYVSQNEAMKDYIPTWIRAIDVLDVVIENCKFIGGGGDELMVITPWYTTSPATPKITFCGNSFSDRIIGATLNLFAYDLIIEHNNFNNFVYAGSVFNLTGENVYCCENIFNNCKIGSAFDGIEGCWFHVENFNVINNTFRGECNIFADGVGERAQIIGNDVEANTLFINELTVFSTNYMPAMLRNTKNRTHGSLIIKDNKCKISGGATSVIRFFLVGVNAVSDVPYTDYAAQDLVSICNNTFIFTDFFTIGTKYFINGTSIVSNIIIDDNVVNNPNLDNVAGTAKWLLYIDNRNVDRTIKNLTFKNNVIDEINDALTQGVKLYTVMDSTKPVELVCDIGNIAYNSSLEVGSTAYVTLKELSTVQPETP